MGFQAWNHLFDGPYPLPEYLKPKPGVFIVWCVIGGEWDILDAGSADDVKASLLLKKPFDSYPGLEPAMVHFSASYLWDPEMRQALLERIKGSSFIAADYRAKITKLGEAEDDKIFGAAKVKNKRFRLLKKLAATPIVPKKILLGLRRKRPLREQEKALKRSLKEGRHGNTP